MFGVWIDDGGGRGVVLPMGRGPGGYFSFVGEYPTEELARAFLATALFQPLVVVMWDRSGGAGFLLDPPTGAWKGSEYLNHSPHGEFGYNVSRPGDHDRALTEARECLTALERQAAED